MRLSAACAGALLVACTAPDAARVTVHTLGGAEIAPLQVAAGRLRVLVFVTTDCPIANAYAPGIAELAQQLHGPDLDWLLVHVDPDVTSEAAAAHARDYGLSLPVALDPQQRLARTVGATVTPETAVLDARGVQYLGRIDDRWRGLGRDSQQAEHHDLRDAIAALRAGRAVSMPRTTAVGCLLPEPRR